MKKIKCRQCKINKPLKDFYISKDGKSGLINICQKCLHLNTKFIESIKHGEFE